MAKSRATSAASERSARSSSGMPQCRPGPKPPKPGPNGPRGPQPKPKPGPKGPRGPRQPQPRGPPNRNPRPGPNGPRGPSPSRDIQGGVQPCQLACSGSGESPGCLLKSPNIVLHLLFNRKNLCDISHLPVGTMRYIFIFPFTIYRIESCKPEND